MKRTLRGAVVVVTGASSGIGRATALLLARRGARVVVAARRAAALAEVAAECERLGGQALAVPVDVADEAAVRELARRAAERFGGIDVWVNNAAVTALGRFEDTPGDVFRRVVETDFFGYVHGARAALPYLRQRGGVLINVASVVAAVAQPYTTAYTAAKWAVRGFATALREELRGTGVDVCTVLPASIDTPLFQHAADYAGRAVKPIPPVYDAAEVAAAIAALAERPRREAMVGRAGRLLALAHTLAPELVERRLRRQVEQEHFQDQPAPPNAGNVFEPAAGTAAVSGGWRRPGRDGSWPTLAAAGLALGGVLGIGWRRWGRALLDRRRLSRALRRARR
jgi:NAD(P)-dependent dehydrogenase (short-subunit alcohol dehydrogenase family)